MPELPRGTVTFLFTDIEGSTALWERDREAMRAAVEQHFVLLDAAITASAGVRFNTVGDAVQAAFPTAPAAVVAAHAAQRSLRAEDWRLPSPLRVRMALHTGEAEPNAHGDYLAAPLNRLSRLLAAGHGGQVLLTQAVQQLCRSALPEGLELRDLGEHRLRDLLEPERVFQLVHPDLPTDFPSLRTLTTRPNNLPRQATPFLGREREVAHVVGLLRQPDVQVLTLIGPGGTGKTRLALRAATEVLCDFTNGVFFVPLAGITNPEHVPRAIAAAVEMREEQAVGLQEWLHAALAVKDLLLVLDNVEHLVEAASFVGELVATSPGLKVLATSRAPLKLRAERQYPVSPLSLPPPSTLAVDEIARSEAVQLFVDRARAVRPHFSLTKDNITVVAEIVRRLDGLPLAIELAAARVSMLPLEAVLARLELRLSLLTSGARDAPARQRTLRNTIAWSYDLLDPNEQSVFEALAVFTGSCTFDAAQAVVGVDLDVFAGLERLLEHSLIQQTDGPDGEPRFAMLATVRDYGLERLDASDHAEAIRLRHATFFLALAEASVDGLRGVDMALWTKRLEADHDNLLSSLTWAIERKQGALALRLAAALRIFWLQHAHFTEARLELARALAFQEDPLARAAALFAAAVFEADDAQRAYTLAEEALRLAQAHGDSIGEVRALTALGNTAATHGDAERAQALLGEALSLAEQVGDVRWMGTIAADLGYAAIDRGELDEAETRFQSALAQFRQVGYAWNEANMFGALSEVAQLRGDQEQAKELMQLSLARHYALHSRWGMLGAIEGLAGLATATEPVRAIYLYGTAAAVREAIGARLPSEEQAYRDHVITMLRSRVGEAQFLETWEAGHVRPWIEVVAEVLAVTSDSGGTMADASPSVD